MAKENITLGKSEWYIMEQLWAATPLTYVQLCHKLKENPGWSRSTVQTMLGRMTDKGILRYEVAGRAKRYYPCVTRDDVAVAETRSLLDRVFEGSASLMMSTLVRKEQLTRSELDELYAILSQLEEKK